MGWIIGFIIYLCFLVFVYYFIYGAGGGQTPVLSEEIEIKTADQLGDELCYYCPLTERGTQSVNTSPFDLCEGRKCSEAYERYIEEQTPEISKQETMNLYFINETDYVAAFNEESAIQFYETEFDIVEEIDEIPKTEWGNMTITIIDDPDEEINGEQQKTTFAEWMEQFSEKDLPLIVASNDY